MNNEEAKEIFSKVKELPCGWCYEGGDEFKKAINHAIKVFEERPQGEWIEVDIKPTPYGGYTCNRKCKRCNYFTKEYRLNYCPNCGADMRKRGVE